jgi:hypothetical protein
MQAADLLKKVSQLFSQSSTKFHEFHSSAVFLLLIRQFGKDLALDFLKINRKEIRK